MAINRSMQKSVSAKMRRRIVFILVCFLGLGFTVVIVQLFRIQVVDGEKYQALAAQQQTRSTTLGAKRGTIFDRNGNVLAQSATVWNVCLSPADIDENTFDGTAEELGEILELDPAYIKEQAEDRTMYYKLIKKRVNREVRDEVLEYITEEDIDGVFFEQDTKRYYTYGNLASNILGFTNYDNHGAYGLESYYDKTLSGTPGVVVSAKNAWGSDMPFKYQQLNEAKDGNDIVLTIDEGIQHFVEKNLETAIVEHAIGNRACGIVMDIQTGEILAMATKGDFDPNDPYTITDPAAIAELEELAEIHTEDSEEYETKLGELRYEQWRNKAISDPYEPGSVFKIITAATALDNKLVPLEENFYCSGALQIPGEDSPRHCHDLDGHGQQTFVQGMENSCNPVFIIVGQRIGGDLMYSYMDNFGLREPTGVDLPGEAEGILHSLSILNKESMSELSSTAFGQTFKVTPLQILTAVSAAVNGGRLMQPYIVKQVRDAEGNVIETTEPVVRRQVISEETSESVRYLVEQVVKEGSGRNAAIPGYRIGGKTGTSEKLDNLNQSKNILSFVGFAPMEDPQYACLVVLDEPVLDNVYGSVIAAPVVGAIFQEMLPYVGLEPEFTEEELAETEVTVPNLLGKRPHEAQSDLTALSLQTHIVGKGATVLRQIPQAGSTMPKGMTVTLYTDEESLSEEVKVPDVVGMTAQEANQAIVTDAGLNIELRGVVEDGTQAIVSEQWPLPGEIAKTGDVVVVTLVEKTEESAEAGA